MSSQAVISFQRVGYTLGYEAGALISTAQISQGSVPQGSDGNHE
jgi:hypothetical protein